MTQNAWVISKGPDPKTLIPTFIHKPPRSPPTGSVAVRVTAPALNHRDYFITQRLYPGIRIGCTLGGDGCGVVLTGPRKGETVVIDPSVGWGPTEEVPEKGMEIIGSPRNGTFAHSVIVPEANIYPKPQHLTDIQAASLPLAGVTAYRALVTKGNAKAGTKVLITGIGGGVAVMAAQFAVAMGCDVYVTSSSDQKIQTAIETLKVKGGVKYTEPNWSKSILAASQSMLDLCIDGAGGNGLNECFKCLRPGGKVVTIGATMGPMASIALPHLFLRQCAIVGSAMGSPRDFAAMLALVNAHKIAPIVDSVYPLESFLEALEKMRTGAQMGKICLSHTTGKAKL